MGFTDAVRTAIKEKYATFSGRASRSEYWWFQLFYWVLMVVIVAIAGGLGAMFTGGDMSNMPTVFYIVVGAPALVIMLGLLVPMLAIQIRRFHDRNMSGWWYLGLIVFGVVPFVGVLGSIAILVISILKGTDGPNKFGPDPLRPEATADVFA